MAKFNPHVLFDPFGALSMEFGVPTCILALTKDILQLLPGDILGGISDGIIQGQEAAQDALANIARKLFIDTGIIEFNADTGTFSFISDISRFGLDSNQQSLLTSVGEFLGAVAGAGQTLWKNYEVLQSQLDAIKACIGDYNLWLEGTDGGGPVTDTTSPKNTSSPAASFAIAQANIGASKEFLITSNRLLKDIGEVLLDRNLNPSRIPNLSDDEVITIEEPIFRLVFGPPKSKVGQFLLSVDGLYYDSQTRSYDGKDIPDATDIGFIPPSEKWELDHEPSLGGKGVTFSIKELGTYVDTIFDPDIIDESPSLETYYECDHFLQVLVGQKNKAVQDIERHKNNLVTSGFTSNSALVVNLQQNILSVIDQYNVQIRKRKKQIEVTVKSSDLFGSNQVFLPGEIPINDFSFLSSINLEVDIEKQRKLTFVQGDVCSIVLPLQPTFVRASESGKNVIISPLVIPPIGAGGMLDSGKYDTTVAPVLSVNSDIVTDGLIAVYNFLETITVPTNSTEFLVLNCATSGVKNNAQLVSDSPSSVYTKGVAIPNLQGIAKRDFNNGLFTLKGLGSYVRLPDSSEFQDLLYNLNGCTIESWIHVKNFNQAVDDFEVYDGNYNHLINFDRDEGKWTTFNYFKILLGSENTGGTAKLNVDSSAIITDNSTDTVRGFLMGFSRDPQIVRNDVVAAGTDLQPNFNSGYSISSVSIAASGSGYCTSGTWTLSSQGGSTPASGVYDVSTNGSTAGSVSSITLLEPGAGFPLSITTTIAMNGDVASPGLDCPPGTTANMEIVLDSAFSVGVSSVFFIAPTQSIGTSDIEFVNKGDCYAASAGIYKLTIPTETIVNSVKFDDVSGAYMHLCVTMDVSANSLKVYLDKNLMAEDTLSNVFGSLVGHPPNLPTFIHPEDRDTSSFYYSSGTVSAIGTTEFDFGPANNKFFTPWILGGGWTDGNPVDASSGGFMGASHGFDSGLTGHVGSVKFYSRPLTITEVITNYNAHSNLFKNIDI